MLHTSLYLWHVRIIYWTVIITLEKFVHTQQLSQNAEYLSQLANHRDVYTYIEVRASRNSCSKWFAFRTLKMLARKKKKKEKKKEKKENFDHRVKSYFLSWFVIQIYYYTHCIPSKAKGNARRRPFFVTIVPIYINYKRIIQTINAMTHELNT